MNRAPRDLSKKSTTNSNVGPGKYLGINTWRKKDPPNTAHRVRFRRNNEAICPAKTKPIQPGPGQYDVKVDVQHQSSGASSVFNSSVARFGAKRMSKHPGPGQYIQHSQWKTPNRVERRALMTKVGARVLSKSIPTIPIPGKNYGYVPTKDGQLLPRKNKTNLAVLKESKTLSSFSSKSRGFDLGKATSRDHINPHRQQVPGPGHYTFCEASGQQETPSVQLNKIIATNRNLVREMRQHHVKKEVQIVPGPGAYDCNFERLPIRNQVVQEFGTTSRRFEQLSSPCRIPGPGQYETHDMFHDTGGSVYESETGVGFASSFCRFEDNEATNNASIPGAGTYDIISSNQFSGCKDQSKSAFGTSTKRFHRGIIPEEHTKEEEKPPIEVAQVKEIIKLSSAKHMKTESVKSRCNSVFSSQTKRMGHSMKNATPDPGAYHNQKHWTEETPHGKLLRTEKRFNENEKFVVPGPGAYNVLSKQSSGGSIVLGGSDSRFKKSKASSVPGPGAYDTEIAHGSLLKHTFNVSIAEEEEAAIYKSAKKCH